MAKKKYEDWEIIEFEETVTELACGIETMADEEYEEKYNSLPEEYQEQVRENERVFADSAVGDASGRSDG